MLYLPHQWEHFSEQSKKKKVFIPKTYVDIYRLRYSIVYYNSKTEDISDFIVSFNVFHECDHFGMMQKRKKEENLRRK